MRNAQFAYTGPMDYPSAGWKAFMDGYVVDFGGGKKGGTSIDTFAIKMKSSDWRRTHAAYQEVYLQQEKPEAVVVSGWSKAEKVSGVVDGGYAVYVDIVFKDGSVKWGYNIPFDVGTHGWQVGPNSKRSNTHTHTPSQLTLYSPLLFCFVFGAAVPGRGDRPGPAHRGAAALLHV